VESGLRNEDYVAFLDESGRDGLQVVAGVFIPARWLRSAERRWRDFVRARTGSSSGRAEVKSYDLTRGGGVALDVQRVVRSQGGPSLRAKAAGRLFYRDALEHIASLSEVRILTVGLETRRPLDAYRLWFWLAYCLLVEHPKAPRPRLPLTVIDGEDISFRDSQDLVAYRFYRAFPRCQPYVAAGTRWFVGGSVLQASHLHPFVQMADLVAGAARRAISRQPLGGDWYQTHLVDHAKGMGRPIDVSGHALSQLKWRSRRDACGSGWRGAYLAIEAKPLAGPRL
jgi:hypothetical protein